MYCKYCGHQLINNTCINENCIKNNKTNIYPSDIIAFIGPNSTSYYMEKCSRYQLDSSFLSWNWICFACPFIWFAYRKMYLESCITFILLFLSTLLLTSYIPFIYLLISTISALVANCSYIKFAINRIFMLKEKAPTIDLNTIKTNGGVNALSLIFTITLFFIFLILYIMKSISIWHLINF